MPDSKTLNIVFVGGCALAAGIKEISLTVPEAHEDEEYDLIMRAICKVVSGHIVYLVTMNGKSLKKTYETGGSVNDGDVIKAIPVVLGG